MDLNVNEVIKAVNGRGIIKKDYGKIKGISVDSRTISEGEVFFALRGKKFDGHNFVNEVRNNSKMPVCISEKVLDSEYILVDDTLTALGSLAKYWRKKINTFVIAITGSIGKTTTKNILGSILSITYSTYTSIRNYNNLVGVPLNIFNLSESYKYAVLELGTNKEGEIRRLAEISLPDIAVITNIGRAHLEFFGSLENILKEKVSISAYTKGPVFINQDDPYLSNAMIKNKFTYGFNGNADYNGKITEETNNGIGIVVNNNPFFVPFKGRGNLYNTLSAIAVTLFLKVPEEIIQKGILKAKMEEMRLQIENYDGINVINDAYNANPDSVENALSVLEKFTGRRIAVLGDMLELGKFSEKLHREVGRFANHRVDILITIGEYARFIYEEFKSKKYKFNTLDEVVEFMKDLLKTGDAILIKGSRKMNMEKIIEKIFGKEEDCSIIYTT